MIGRLARRLAGQPRVASGACAVIHDTGMIDAECTGKTVGVMAVAAIGTGGWMTRRLADRVYAVVAVMA